LPEQLEYVENYAKENRHFSFKKLLTRQRTKMKTIVTFLAVLELMKAGKIRISQTEIFGDIEIDALEDTDGAA
jgi:segregation and condensation protein A